MATAFITKNNIKMEQLLAKENIIGIIGGAGPDATELLYKNIIELARTKYGAHRLEQYPSLLIGSFPVLQDINNDKELDQVIESLCDSADKLKIAGAKHLCFACNTHHLAIDVVRKHVGLPFISMVDLVQNKIKNEGYKSVAVIGTSYTLDQALYAKPLKSLGVEIIELLPELAKKSHTIIGEALAGIPSELTKEYVNFIKEVENTAEFDALILGCTEYSVLEYRRKLESYPTKLPIVDPLIELSLEIARMYYEESSG